MRVLAFFDLSQLPIAWAVARGTIHSADAIEQGENGFISYMLAGMVLAQNNRRLFNEAIIEKYREQYHPQETSRLRGFYFFGTREEAERLIGNKDWPPYFQQANLLEVELRHIASLSRLDADWITYAPRDERGYLKSDELDWLDSYWKGVPKSCAPTWEYIVSGIGVILDSDRRRSIYDEIENSYPEYKVPLLMTRLASETGSKGGLMTPALETDADGVVSLHYLWSNSEFHEREAITRIAAHPDAGLLGHLMRTTDGWPIPDLRDWETKFSVGQRTIAALDSIAIPSVHHE